MAIERRKERKKENEKMTIESTKYKKKKNPLREEKNK